MPGVFPGRRIERMELNLDSDVGVAGKASSIGWKLGLVSRREDCEPVC